MAQVAQIRKTVSRPLTHTTHTTIHYLVTSLTPDQVSARRLLDIFRGHWSIENRLFHVKDDSFGEDRHVLRSHRAAQSTSLLRACALNLLRGRCSLWTDREPLTGRAQFLNAHPSSILSLSG